MIFRNYQYRFIARFTTLAGFCLAGMSLLSHADMTGSASRMETLLVTGEQQQITLAADNLPAKTTTIDSEEILATNVGRDISNIFRRVPGVLANNIDQGDTGNGFRMRGFATQGTHGADTAIYVDGVPQNLPSSEAGAGHGPAFLEWLTPNMIQKVEVIKGPISVLHGDQNRAGAVNIHTVGSDVRSSVGVAIESYEGRRGNLVLSGKIGQVDHVLVADTYDAEGFRDQSETRRDNIFWKGSTVFNDGFYSFSLNHYRTDFIAAGYLGYDRLVAGAVEPQAVQENALPSYGENSQTGIVFNRRPASSEYGLYATVYGLDIDRQRGTTGGSVVHNVGEDDRKAIGGRIATNMAAGEDAAVFVGIDFRRDRGDAIRERYENYLGTGNFLTNLDIDLVTYGVFVQGQYRFAENWKAIGGVRYDGFDYKIDNRKFTDADADYSDGVITPKFGLAWIAAPRLELFANVAEGFRSPAAQQISPGGSLGPLGRSGGLMNTEISPSKVRSYDAGFTAELVEQLTLSASVYYIENEDEIAQTAPDTFSSVGGSTRKGFEMDLRYQPTDQFSMYANYARVLEAVLVDPTRGTGQSISVPETLAKIGATYGTFVGNGQLAVNADAYVSADIPYYSGTPSAERDMPTFTRYDTRISYTLAPYEMAIYWTWQPHEFASEAAYATATGLMVSPQPTDFGGISLRYQF